MKISRVQLTYLGVVITIGIVLFILYRYAEDSPLKISSEEAKRKIAAKEIDLIVDVRTDLERSTLGFYPGSIHITSDSLEITMKTVFPDKRMRILVYCNTGQRARRAAERLTAMGYKNVVYISGSYKSLE
jgi:phage shock protein E